MKERKIDIKLFLLLLLLSPCLSYGQQDLSVTDTIYHVRLWDGSVIKGKLISRQNDEIVLQAPDYGSVTIREKLVLSIMTVTVVHKKPRVLNEAPTSTHYFISPSAIPMQKGELNIQDAELFFVKGNYAITDNISVGAGINLVAPVVGTYRDGEGGLLPMANIKAGGKITRWLYLGANAFVARAPATTYNTANPFYEYFPDNTYEAVTMASGIVTVGNKFNNVSASVEYDYINRSPASGPTYTLSGMLRLGPHVSLITENWYFPATGNNFVFGPYNPGDERFEDLLNYPTGPVKQYYYIVSCGVRMVAGRVSFDLGFATNQYMLSNPETSDNPLLAYPYAACMIRIL